jgi:pimeloyl-ACP methyl ester carboxylesterase
MASCSLVLDVARQDIVNGQRLAAAALLDDGQGAKPNAGSSLWPDAGPPLSWKERAAAAPPVVRSLDVVGVEIRYEIWGQRSALPDIVLVHGMHAHTRWWDPIASYLAEERRVVSFDFSGMGESGHRERYDIQLHADEIRAVTHATEAAGGIVIAHSYGATPSILAGLRSHDLFSKMVILDSRISLPGMEPLTGSGAHVHWEKKIYKTFEEALCRFRLTPSGPLADPEVLNHIAHHSIRQIEGGWTWKFDSQLLRRIDLNMLIDPSELTLPITYIQGECSNVSTPERMMLNRRYLPGARYLTLPAAGHHLMIDQPLALVSMLRGLLAPR